MGKAKARKAPPVEVETVVAGDGVTRPKPGDEVTCHYVGTLKADGTMFDSSRAKGTPFTFTLGKGTVIQGWEQAFVQLSYGQRAKLTIASSAAYGAAGCRDEANASGTGVIPPHADLCFDVELLDINHEHNVVARAKLDKFKTQMLSNFDAGGDLQAKMTELYGGRDGYEAHLDKMAATKLGAMRPSKAAEPPKVERPPVASDSADVAGVVHELQRMVLNPGDAGAEPEASAAEGAAPKGSAPPSTLSFDARFALVKIEANDDDERASANFPRSMHNAAELFAHLGHGQSAARLHACTTALLRTLEQGPDGSTTHSMGRACVCWACGHVGLPANADKCSASGPTPQGKCAHCGGADQTNFVRVTQQRDGAVVPWIEHRATGLEAR